MTAPPRGIFPSPKLAGSCPVEHLLDSSSNASPSVGSCLPDRRKKLDDHIDINVSGRERTEGLVRPLKAGHPLSAMLWIAPGISVLIEVGLGAICEGHASGRFAQPGVSSRSPGAVAFLYRINSVLDHLSELSRSLAGFL